MRLAIAPSIRPGLQARDRSLRRDIARSEWPVAVGAFLLLFGSIAGLRLAHSSADSSTPLPSAQPASPRAGAD